MLDTLGRLVRRVEFSGPSCDVPAPLPAESREETWTYGISKPIAQGLSLDLNQVTSISRRSAVSTGNSASQTYDYEQAARSFDPPGYTCASVPLAAGSVV